MGNRMLYSAKLGTVSFARGRWLMAGHLALEKLSALHNGIRLSMTRRDCK